MKLSVLMITYNHEPFIAQALDSILEQQVDFDYEIVIGEDCSTDNTRKILLNYQRAHFDKIRLLQTDKNMGMLPNFVRTYKACTGDYVALIEGDDYWNDPTKLQKQVDLLDKQHEIAICFHNCEEFFDDDSRPSWYYVPQKQPRISDLDDLISGCNFIPTCSAVFRNRLFVDFPDWYFTLNMGDWTLHILNAHYGKIAYIDEVMGRHRHHVGGVWSLRRQAENLLDENKAYETLKKNLDRRFEPQISKRISFNYYRLAVEFSKSDAGESVRYLRLSYSTSRNKLTALKRVCNSLVMLMRNLPMRWRLHHS